MLSCALLRNRPSSRFIELVFSQGEPGVFMVKSLKRSTQKGLKKRIEEEEEQDGEIAVSRHLTCEDTHASFRR